MEKVASEGKLGETMVSTSRSQTVQDPGLPALPINRETTDYIIITQDILDAFKERVVKSHKVTLNLDSNRNQDRGPSRQKSDASRTRNDNFRLLHNDFRLLHGKAYTSLDLREMVPRRPVRVFVEDITKQCEQTEIENADNKGSKRKNKLVSANSAERAVKR